MNAESKLGTIVTWKAPTAVRLDDLRAALAAAGFPLDYAPDLRPQNVLARALRDMRQGRVITRLQRVDHDTMRFQLTRVHTNAHAADYDREAVVTLDLRSCVVSADDPQIERRARELVAEHASRRVTSDLSRMIQRIFDDRRADLVSIREQGGA